VAGQEQQKTSVFLSVTGRMFTIYFQRSFSIPFIGLARTSTCFRLQFTASYKQTTNQPTNETKTKKESFLLMTHATMANETKPTKGRERKEINLVVEGKFRHYYTTVIAVAFPSTCVCVCVSVLCQLKTQLTTLRCCYCCCRCCFILPLTIIVLVRRHP